MKKIIEKVLKELESESPRLDYIRGLLEAVSEQEDKQTVMQSSGTPFMTVPLPNAQVNTPTIELPKADTPGSFAGMQPKRK